jgi:hypothetical protein
MPALSLLPLGVCSAVAGLLPSKPYVYVKYGIVQEGLAS